MMNNTSIKIQGPNLILMLLLLCLVGLTAKAQTTSFTFRGDIPAELISGTYEMEFKLFDAATGGNQIGATFTIAQVEVAGGFIVQLDFGSAVFTGADRFVEFGLRNSNQFPFAVLMPRKQILPVPYSIRSANATSADTAVNAQQLGGVDASSFVQTTDPRMTDARVPTPGSGNYIQNQSAAPQAGANFNIQGNGTVGGTLSATSVNTSSWYTVGGLPVLSVVDSLFNTTVGLRAGHSSGGAFNSYFGSFAGRFGIAGFENSFFGSNSGIASSGDRNSFFGSNTGGSGGSFNSFFGAYAGVENYGKENSFFGESAGSKNTSGERNSFFGRSSGISNTDGDLNSFFGYNAGLSNTTENGNTFVGALSNGTAGITNATAIGSSAVVTRSNSVVLGNSANVGIGTSAPLAKLHIQGGGVYTGTAGQGVILKAPNGAVCRQLTIDNAGALVITAVPCP